VSGTLTPQQALDRLAAGAWDPQGLPPASAVPWDALLALPGAGSLGGLLHVATRGLGAGVPAAAREFFEASYYLAAAENARGQQQLAEVGRALSAAGTPLLLLKGAALGESLYLSYALRTVGDIDLLVPRDRTAECRRVLLESGYRPAAVEHQAGSRLGYSNQEAFSPPDPADACVELHWHLLDVPYHMAKVPVDFFWRESEERVIAGHPFRVLNARANLVYLPAHLALHHQFRSYRSLVDLALLVAQGGEGLDWAAVGESARAFELLAALRAAVERLAERWPSLPLTGARRVLGGLRPSRTDERLFRLLSAHDRSTTLDFYTTLATLPDLRSRARYAWFNLFPQPAYMERRYGVRSRYALPYWYAVRLGGGLARLARAVPRARRIERRGEPGGR
jgi:hypothetical protein